MSQSIRKASTSPKVQKKTDLQSKLKQLQSQKSEIQQKREQEPTQLNAKLMQKLTEDCLKGCNLIESHDQQGSPDNSSQAHDDRHYCTDVISTHKERVDEKGNLLLQDDTYKIVDYKPNCRHCRDLQCDIQTMKIKPGSSGPKKSLALKHQKTTPIKAQPPKPLKITSIYEFKDLKPYDNDQLIEFIIKLQQEIARLRLENRKLAGKQKTVEDPEIQSVLKQAHMIFLQLKSILDSPQSDDKPIKSKKLIESSEITKKLQKLLAKLGSKEEQNPLIPFQDNAVQTDGDDELQQLMQIQEQELQELRDKITDLQRDNITLQKQILKAKHSDQKSELFAEQLRELNMKLIQQQHEHEQKILQLESDHSKEILQLSKDFKQQMEEINSDRKQINQNIDSDLKQQLHEITLERDCLLEEKAKYMEEYEKWKDEISGHDFNEFPQPVQRSQSMFSHIKSYDTKAIDNLKAKIDQLTEENEQLKSQLEEKETVVGRMSKSARDGKQNFQHVFDNLTQQNCDLQEQLREKQLDLDDNQEQLKRLQQELTEKEQDHQIIVETLTNQNKKLQSALKEKSDTLQQKEKEIEKIFHEKDQQTNKIITDLKKKLQNVIDQNTSDKLKQKTLEDSLKDLESQLNQKQSENEKVQQELKETQELAEELHRQTIGERIGDPTYRETMTILEERDNYIETLRKEITEVEVTNTETVTELKREISDLELQNKDFENRVSELLRQLQGKQILMNKMESDLNKHKDRVRELEEQLKQKDEDFVQKIETEKKELQTQIDLLTQQLEEKTKENEQFQFDNQELLEGAEAIQEDHAAELQEKEEEYEKLNQLLQETIEEVKQKEEEVETVTNQKEELVEQVKEHLKTIQMLRDSSGGNDVDMQDLLDQNTELEQEVTLLRDTENELQRQKTRLQTEVDKLIQNQSTDEESLQEMQKMVYQMQDQIKEQKEKITSLVEESEQKDTFVTQLNIQISNLNSQITKLQERAADEKLDIVSKYEEQVKPQTESTIVATTRFTEQEADPFLLQMLHCQAMTIEQNATE